MYYNTFQEEGERNNISMVKALIVVHLFETDALSSDIMYYIECLLVYIVLHRSRYNGAFSAAAECEERGGGEGLSSSGVSLPLPLSLLERQRALFGWLGLAWLGLGWRSSSLAATMNQGGMIFDEYGRPFIILREQQQRARLRGKDAQKVGHWLVDGWV
jgi:hypothetical protein